MSFSLPCDFSGSQPCPHCHQHPHCYPPVTPLPFKTHTHQTPVRRSSFGCGIRAAHGKRQTPSMGTLIEWQSICAATSHEASVFGGGRDLSHRNSEVLNSRPFCTFSSEARGCVRRLGPVRLPDWLCFSFLFPSTGLWIFFEYFPHRRLFLVATCSGRLHAIPLDKLLQVSLLGCSVSSRWRTV